MTELFKPIPGYEGHYKISNKGNVLSQARTITRKDGFQQRIQERILPPSTDGCGHKIVILSKQGKTEIRKVSQLMLEVFSPSYNPRTDRVVYRDGNPENLSKTNLRNEMMTSRTGGSVTVDRGTGAKKKSYLTLKLAAEKLKFNYNTILDDVLDDTYVPTRGITIKFDTPFRYRKTTFSKIVL